MKIGLKLESKVSRKLGDLLLLEKFRKKKRNIFHYVFAFVLFTGLLCYTTNLPAGIYKLFGSRSNGYLDQGVVLQGEGEGEDLPMRCSLPKLNPFDSSILEYIKPPPEIDCSAGDFPPIFRTDFGSKLILNRELNNVKCCYKTSQGRGTSDSVLKFSQVCHPIKDPITEISPLYEFIQVYCENIVRDLSTKTSAPSNSTTEASPPPQNFTDFFAFVPLKPAVEYRTKNFAKHPSSGEKLNVVLLGLDAQSRMNFIRQMPSSHAYLTQNLSAIEMRGYTKVGDNTFPNVVPLLTGLNISELSSTCWTNKRNSYFDKCPFIWKDFKDAGYRTSYAEDSVWMGTFNYDKKGFYEQPTDYYLNPLTFQMSRQVGHEMWGNAKLCYGSRLSFEVLLDYLVKTAVAFAPGNLPYFQFIWANSLFHDYLNHPKLADELFVQTLGFLAGNGFLNNTVLVLLSDHGMRWGSIRSTYQGKLEERMPMAYFVFPPWFLKDEGFAKGVAALRENSDRLTTPFDIHETLRSLLNLKEITERRRSLPTNGLARGLNLFFKVPALRTCRLADIEEHWCVCNRMQTISKKFPIVISAANFILQAVNEILRNYTLCAKLSLRKINSVLRKIDGDFDTGVSNVSEQSPDLTSSLGAIINEAEHASMKSSIQLQVTLVAKPGDAVLEATVYGNADRWQLSGEISRLNLYRSSSSCVKDQLAQKYCFCKDDGLN